MYALISWSTKNGVALEREELEVRSTSKLTIMNGGKMEPGATKTMFSLSYLGCFSKKKDTFLVFECSFVL